MEITSTNINCAPKVGFPPTGGQDGDIARGGKMGDKRVPFEDEAICDECGAVGAYNFMGDYLCPKCTGEALKEENARKE